MVSCPSCGKGLPAGDFPFCPFCTAPLDVQPAAPRELRKTVTVVFCDVVGSTALGDVVDPEALRELLARYYEGMRSIVEGHGGTVEKFIGDAVVAVFGVPAVHEDDALRACRAAMEMQAALPALGVGCRIGVNTGEVVTANDDALVTGDAVNVAARLEQVAGVGEVLIGDETLQLVRSAVHVGARRALELKGKSELVGAYPLLSASGELHRRFSSPMVGREHELARLRAVFGQAVHDRSCQLVTVLGSAGVGKSRLTAEFLAAVDATVLRGRCLSYGDGITYWPVVEVIKQASTLPDGDAARPLRALLGESVDSSTAEEIAWGFRKLLEQQAQTRPVVCVFDDLHWGEETLLDLVEHVADLSRDAPLLLLCMARPELLERRSSWGGGKWNATSVLLEPLDAAETELLLSELGGADDVLRERIVRVAEGNPLFLEEMLALVRDSPGGAVEVPPTIQALLAARLDQLDPGERGVLERGSVEGRLFHRGAVAALADGDGHIDQRLLSLVRKELVRPDRPQLADEDAYRFRHLLIRDAAYDALSKATRSDLHQRFADWLEVNGRSLVELDEILGYHLEQAARYLAELKRPDDAVAKRAAAHLGAAGRRARLRGDSRAASSLFDRSFALDDEPDVHLLLHFSAVGDSRITAALLEAAAERADHVGDVSAAALARAVAAAQRLDFTEVSPGEQERLAQEALPLLEAAGDDAGLAAVWSSLAYGAYNTFCRYDRMEHASEQALHHAERAGERPAYPVMLGTALRLGGRPAAEGLRRLEELAATFPSPTVTLTRAVLLAMLGRFEDARALLASGIDRLKELYASELPSLAVAEIEELAGNSTLAAEQYGAFCDWLAQNDRTALLSTYGPTRGRVLCSLGRFDEAELHAHQGRDLGDDHDPITQGLWRQVEALVAAGRGDYGVAEQLADEALTFAWKTDSPGFQADALADRGIVLETAGRYAEAANAFGEALVLYEQKGIVPLARRTRERLTAIQTSA